MEEEKVAPNYESKDQSDHNMTDKEDPGAVAEIQASYTPEEEKKVLRKIDSVVLPFVSFNSSRKNQYNDNVCANILDRCASSFSCSTSTSRVSAMPVSSV